ncbi:YraN family protein [Salinisphaera sp.]|uniref:YraN family protein n=1 Tax=Salinisphaera sp. TaxID=1914330 RepID=UPI002D76A789|nr:YraN family protein [Salinisphaera sp.]HET7315144.1 YraN family protein [Salinisphaera sp.]
MAVGKLSRLALGRDAETRVDRAARRRGWRRVARNYNVRGGELDLVYRTADLLVVIEVRYRSRGDYGGAAASVTRAKQRRIILATRYLLAAHPEYADLAVRFDVVGVDRADTLNWIENAFYAE